MLGDDLAGNPFLHLGEALRALRIKRGLSQAEAAAAAGVRPSQISRWENGKASKMKAESLGSLLVAYQADLGDLLRELDHFEARPRMSPADTLEAFDSLISSTLGRLRNTADFPQPETGQRLRQLRERSGWTREEIAERMKFPLEALTSFEEGGDAKLSRPELEALARACCGTLEDVLPDHRGGIAETVWPSFGGCSFDPDG